MLIGIRVLMALVLFIMGAVACGAGLYTILAHQYQATLRSLSAQAALLGNRVSTDTTIEPILDSKEFIEWLDSLDVVESVAFTAKLPNPEPTTAFDDLAGRIGDAHGTEYSARMKTTREEGLQHIEEDPEFRQAIAMGKKGFAELEGRGRRNGKPTRYRQKDEVASETISHLPADWQDLRGMLKEMVRTRLRTFLLDDDDGPT